MVSTSEDGATMKFLPEYPSVAALREHLSGLQARILSALWMLTWTCAFAILTWWCLRLAEGRTAA